MMKILKFGVNRIDLKGKKYDNQVMEIASVVDVRGSSNPELFIYLDSKLVTTIVITKDMARQIESGSGISLNALTLTDNSIAFKLVKSEDPFTEIVNYHYYTAVLPQVNLKSLVASALFHPLQVSEDINVVRCKATKSQDLIDLVNKGVAKPEPKLNEIAKKISADSLCRNLSTEELLHLIAVLEDIVETRHN